MQTRALPSLIGDRDALAIQLDGLSADQSPEDLSRILGAAFAERELYDLYLSSLVGNEKRAKALLEVFDKAITALKYDPKIFEEFYHLCGWLGLLPSSHIVPVNLIQTSEVAVASDDHGDIWEGICNDKRVAIKALRVYKEDDVRKVAKVLYKEVVVWRRISHPNIVPFLGVSEALAPLSILSEWMPNGNVRNYVVKKTETSRLQLLLDISYGLSFLHCLGIMHGDLKGDNILIDELGRARLNDFGFSSVASLNCAETSASGSEGSHLRVAPELFIYNEGKSGLPTCESDVFALGMVTFEVFTGHVPFSENKASAIVMKRITDGERPPRPPKGKKLGLSDGFWKIIQSSLAHEAEERPTISTFIDFLDGATPDITVLEELTEFDVNSEEHIQELRHLFGYGDNTLLGMREEETLIVIEVFDRVLNSSLNDSTLRSRCLRGLQKVSTRCGLLPKSHWISHSTLIGTDDAPSATVGISSTRQRFVDGKLVAVKAISPNCVENFYVFGHKLWTSGIMWKRLQHPNVVPFLGFDPTTPPFSLVYPWMSNGSLSEYARKNPHADKISLLLDVARGLAYLHQYNIVHGNLTGNNILVDSGGVARISEYGLENVLRDESFSKSIPTNVRWMAPEILLTETKDKRAASVDDGRRADVYSFAVVMFEAVSGSTAFPGKRDDEVFESVIMGLRPEWPPWVAPQWFGDTIWEQVEACWSHDPEERPTALVVLQALQKLGEEGPQTFQPQELSRDDTWDYLEDTPEPNPNVHSILSSSTLVDGSIGRFFAVLHHRGSSAPKHGSSKSRRNEGKRQVRRLLRLPKRRLITVRDIVGRKPGAVTEEREEVLRVSNDCVPYIVSQPIPPGKTLRNVVIAIVSKDQGWSSYPSDHGTYRNSWTWFELSVGSESGEKWRGEVVRNCHAHGEFKEHTVKILAEEFYEKAQSGDVLTVWALAKFPGWKNTVKKVTVGYVVE